MQHTPLEDAVRQLSEANLALIALPGPEVRQVALTALRARMHLFIMSSDVSLADELAIKAEGRSRGQLVMGPDCSMGLIDGVRLGYTNQVRRGPIGIAGTSGTGMQEVSTLIHRLGSGVSQAIGVGSNDMSAEVGGSSMLDAIDRLEQDPATEVIILLSSPPAPEVARGILARARDCYKPLVIHFLGSNVQGIDEHMAFVRTMHEAATTAVELAMIDGDHAALNGADPPAPPLRVATTERYVRGVFSSEALAGEAVSMLRRRLGNVATNLSMPGATPLADAQQSRGHTVFAMPDVQFGRSRSISDPSLRNARLLQEAQDPFTAVLLFDVILGLGAPADPAAAFAQVVNAIRTAAIGRAITLIASVCGTDDDAQPRSQQVATLETAGVLVAPSNAVATEWAARLI